jgi:hypothetical protein
MGQAHFDMINSRHMPARVHKPVGKFPVIGQKDQPFRKKIKPSHRVNTPSFICGRQKINHGFAPFRIFYRAHNTDGLMEHQNTRFFPRTENNLFALTHNTVFFPVNAKGRAFCLDAINRNQACKNQLIGFSSGTNTCIGKGFIEADCLLFHFYSFFVAFLSGA